MILRRTAARLSGLGLVVLTVAATLLVGVGPATATDVRMQAPFGFFADNLSFRLDAMTPSVVTSGGGNTLTVRGAATNGAEVPVTDLIVRFQRGAALPDSRSVEAEIADPGQPVDVIADDWSAFADRIDSGGSRTFALATTISGPGAGSLRIDAPGVYPLMINVNGTRSVDGVPTDVRLGELHLLVTVTSLPDGVGLAASTTDTTTTDTTTTGTSATGTGTGPDPTPVPVGLLWPLTSRPHRGVAGVFLDDSLADEVSAGGQLDERLDALESSEFPAGAVTLMIDPMLLDELASMAGGYRLLQPGRIQSPVTAPPAATTTAPTTEGSAGVSGSAAVPDPGGSTVVTPTGAAPASSAPATTATATDTPTSTEGPADPPTEAPAQTPTEPDPATAAGTRGAAAAEFLQRVQELTDGRPVVVLPYSDPDGIAVTRAGLGSGVRDLHTLGDAVAARTLPDADLITSVAVPPDGIADAATLDTYRGAGFTATVLSRSSGTGTTAATGVGRIDTASGRSLSALIGDNQVEPLLADVLAPAAGETGALALNTAVALLGRRHLDGATAAVVQLPGAVIDTAGLDDLGAAVTALTDDGFVGPADLPGLAAGAPADSAITARIPETTVTLSSEYLTGLGAAHSDLRSLASVLAPQGTGPGADLVSTLTDALRPLTSTSLRASTAPAAAVLATTAGSAGLLREAVSIRKTVGSYTLASTDSPLVLTLQNTLPFAVRVKIRIDGGQAVGLSTQVPTFVDLAANGTEQVRIPATVSRAGSFGVSAQLLAPDDRTWGVAVPLQIRSNAYGALTIILISVAGGVLLLMVVLRIWQRIRDSGRSRATADPAATATDSASGDAPGTTPVTAVTAVSETAPTTASTSDER